ncbi:uncharacterized protein [Gorilla gorilla gorilla]|uniref:uncharacterized protein n=1 Tax=Gorilla gorilla gorilla TaxID=9595 RepID=UPI003007F559
MTSPPPPIRPPPPSIVNMKEKHKERIPVTTGRTFQLRNSGWLCRTILTLERGKLKEKAEHAINKARTPTAIPGREPPTPAKSIDSAWDACCFRTSVATYPSLEGIFPRMAS